MPPDTKPPNPLFKLVIAGSVVFVLTILLMIVTALGSIESRLVRFFDEHGMKLIGVEVALILLLAFAAMSLDRRQTAAAMKRESEQNGGADSSAGDPVAASADGDRDSDSDQPRRSHRVP